jgi:excisionase family DNA binding protein
MTEDANRPAGRPEGRDYLTTEQACRYLNVSRPTLYAWARRVEPKVKRLVRGNRLVRWPKAELDQMAKLSLRTVR